MTPARTTPSPKADGVDRRTRRGTGEIRKLILDAARASFDERGYARSTTRDIAARADVAEVLLFRNFGSKANLFVEAVLNPLMEIFADALEMLDPAKDADIEEHQRAFTDHLYKLVREHRGLITTYFATRMFEPDVLEGHEAEAVMQSKIDEMAAKAEDRLRRLGVDVSDMNVGVSARSNIGMILAVALFEDWLLPSGRRKPKQRDVIDELTRQALYGGYNEKSRAPRRRNG
jgi:AcrR family transcriptional regulator